MLRLFLLFTVLPYHSYTGTAVKCPLIYRLFFGGTLFAVMLHMLILSMLDPNSLRVWIPGQRLLFHPHHDDDFYRRRHVWLLLTFSLASCLCHLIMLQHVTSTAPDQASALDRRRQILLQQRRKSQPLFYYASRRWNQGRSDLHPERGALLQNHNNGNGHHDDDGAELRRAQWHQEDGNGDSNHIMDRISAQSYGKKYMEFLSHVLVLARISHIACLPFICMIEFVMDLQNKLQIAKRQWAQRLEDFSSKITSPNQTNTNLNGMSNESNQSFPKIRRASSGSRLNHALSPLTPFRVLLQLFAYEEVLDNGRLDSVFFVDNGAAITFFVPQLLNFLLYGAYESGSIGLEDWILDKCRRNAFFAHRCFWYLRAWCLHLPAQLAPPPKREGSHPSLLSVSNSQQQLLISDGRLQRSFSNGSLTVKNFLRDVDNGAASLDDSLSVHSFSSRGAGCKTHNLPQQQQPPHAKFLPEERAVIEALMFRVMECGEESAGILQFGAPTSNGTDRDEGDDLECAQADTASSELPPFPSFSVDSSNTGPFSPSAIMTAAESGSIPIDPDTGYPSLKHLDVLCAPQKFGFLPLLSKKTNSVKGKNHIRPRQPHSISIPPVIPGGGRLSHNDEAPDMESWFEATPRFLDALIALADNLLLVPREKRQEELRKHLQSLEVELLPCNAIYVPVNNMHHRVWRIVAEESIALSTKERVPCIVCLEVVNYTPIVQAPPRRRSILEKVKTSLRSKPSTEEVRSTASLSEDDVASTHSVQPSFSIPVQSHSTEKEIVYQWRTERRDPRRGESIIGKVTHTVREGINKIPLESVRETMTKISDPRAIHDLLNMSSVDIEVGRSADEEDKRPAMKTRASDNDVSREIESGTGIEEKSGMSSQFVNEVTVVAPTTPLPRSNRVTPTNVHMGQWLTPSPGRMLVNQENGLQSLVTIRRKMESLKDSESLPPYGSTSEMQRKGSMPPRSTKKGEKVSNSSVNQVSTIPAVKPPPVVFKESWKKKEDRVRAKSAYGSHPGWRLLPVLIKSNDGEHDTHVVCFLIETFLLVWSHYFKRIGALTLCYLDDRSWKIYDKSNWHIS